MTVKKPIEKWADADSYNLAAFDQTEGAWQIDHPLPLPAWSKTVKQPMIIDKVISIKKKTQKPNNLQILSLIGMAI